MTEERLDLPQGTLDLLILKALALQPMHGWGVSERLQQISQEALKVQQGSLYPALHRLERRGWIKAEWATSENHRRAKYYRLEHEAEKYSRRGVAPEDAVRQARVALGGVAQLQQQCRETPGTRLLEDLLQDIRYAIRSFAKTPALSLMIVLSLAIGIGANTAIFSLTSALLLKPLPYKDPDRLAILWLRSPGIGIPQDWSSPGQYHDIVTQNHVFDETALAFGDDFILKEGSRAIKVDAIEATANLPPMLGAKAMLGRIFLPEEDLPGKPQTVVLTYGFWQRAFAGDATVVCTA